MAVVVFVVIVAVVVVVVGVVFSWGVVVSLSSQVIVSFVTYLVN